ncbi:MAG: DUF1995 family protein [Synechococcaceae bacterium WB4_1_0192]|nr:DUF1995 family protein [Synechococcaceae bacterium WB4_1_0192]
MLPADLRTAEAEALGAVLAALSAGAKGLWTVEFRFEGLRIMPVALRLLAALTPRYPDLRLLFPDAGATALAKRDAPDQAAQLSSLSDLMRLQQADGGSDGILLLVAPTPADYDEVEQVCAQHRGVGPASRCRTAGGGPLQLWRRSVPAGGGSLHRRLAQLSRPAS